MPPPSDASGKEPAFAAIFAHRSMLRAYIQAIVRDPALVEDVLSEAVVSLASRWEVYDPALPFAPWARGVARRVALKSLQKLGRAELGLPEDVLEFLGAAMDSLGDEAALERQKQQLHQCLAQLSSSNRELIQLRYFEELRAEVIADRVQRSVAAVYTAYTRLHAALLRCMRKADGGVS